MIGLGLNIDQYTQEQPVVNFFSSTDVLNNTGYWVSRNITGWNQVGTDVLGGTDSYQIRANGTTNTHGLRSETNTLSLVAGTTYTISTFVKKQLTNKGRMRVDPNFFNSTPQLEFDLSNGTVVGLNKDGNSAYVEDGIQDCGNGWYKIWLTFIPDNTTSRFAEFLIYDESDNVTFSGNGSQGYLMCHPQINEGYLKKYTQN